MGNYSHKDIESAFEYAQKNPNSKLKDWIKERGKTITKREITLYKGFEYDRFDINGSKFILLKVPNYSKQILEHLINKIVGTKGYYLLSPSPGEWRGIDYCVLSTDKKFFTVSDWDDLDGYKGVKHIGTDVKFVYDIDCEDWDEYDYEKWDNYKYYMKNNNLALWDGNSGLMFYLSEDLDLDLKPIKEFFNK